MYCNSTLAASMKTQALPPRSTHADTPELAVDSHFGRYQVGRRIGAGGMGVVHEAVHTLLRKRVALKTMLPGEMSDAVLARFLREAESAARVHHPNVVDIVDVGVEGGVPFMVMELLEGEDLGQLLQRERRLPVQATIDLVLPIVAGLSAAHRLDIVHRDIKPENVFLAADTHGGAIPKLVDFGISLDVGPAADTAASQYLSPSGTPHYMAPEQIRGRGIDARTDQYAVGVLLFSCLAGRRPFEGESLVDLLLAVDQGEFVPLRVLCDEVPAELEAIVHRAMAREKEDRYATTDELGCALLPFASDAVRAAHARSFEPERRASTPPQRWSDADLVRCCADLLAQEQPLLAARVPSAADSPEPAVQQDAQRRAGIVASTQCLAWCALSLGTASLSTVAALAGAGGMPSTSPAGLAEQVQVGAP